MVRESTGTTPSRQTPTKQKQKLTSKKKYIDSKRYRNFNNFMN
jgi:hypothetical protein